MPLDYKLCIVIPCHNHGKTIKQVVESLLDYKLPIIIVDDGCNETDKALIKECINTYKNICTLIEHPINQGKGVALSSSFKLAFKQGFTHALQIDADGQHDVKAITKLIEVSQKHPQALISGKPIYDESIPKSRKIGRYITHFWVFIETLSFSIKDSMCGFRIYPLNTSAKLAPLCGKGMAFDTEIMVRLYWLGVKSYFVPVKVIYPENGISNFKVFKDNLKISLMHTKLVTLMLLQLPKLLILKNKG